MTVSFELDIRQKTLIKMTRDFAQNVIRPVAAQYDRSGEFPWPVVEKAWEVGLFNLSVPEQYGGGGLSGLDVCLVSEELSFGCAAIAACISINDLACIPIVLAGSSEQKQKFLGEINLDRKLIALCVTEPEAGSDVSAISTTAARQSGGYILNGTKCFITNGSVADYYVVFAKTDKTAGHKGISAFIVPRRAPGVSIGKKEDKMGQRASDTSEVVFQDVFVPDANRLGQEGEGFRLIMATFNRSRPGVAASAVGLSRAAMEYALQYAKTRNQFGLPIIFNQAIMFMISDMAREIESARLLSWKAAWLADQGLDNAMEAAMAKVTAADAAMRITTDAVQIHGGYGYMKEYPVEKLMRDAKVLQIYEGTSQIQKLLIMRSMLKT